MTKTKTNYGEFDLTVTGHRARIARPSDPVAGAPAKPVKTVDPDKPKYRSKTEARYAGHLEAMRTLGQIREARYEAFRVQLADNTHLTADFWVDMPDRSVEIHEVKGKYIWEDGWIKLKMAARLWPHFRWFKVEWKTCQWVKTRVRG